MHSNACEPRRACATATGRSRCRCAAALLVTAACALPAAAPANAARQACAGAAGVPGTAGGAALRRALYCLINAERARQGLRALRRSRRLAGAAGRQASDMVMRGYFDHERAGWTLHGRLRAAGWSGGLAAETIAWGCGRLGVPRAVLDGWLASPPHRQIVLGPFSRAGVGLAIGSPGPLGCSAAGTWVLDVGGR